MEPQDKKIRKIKMRKLLFIAALLIGFNAHAQYFVSIMPALTSSSGSFQQKGNLSLEVGKQWDCFSIGFDIGETNFTYNPIKDKSLYFECRPNINVFQQGKFTNTITTGIGILPYYNELLIESTVGIEYSYSETLHINLMCGQFNYSGGQRTTSETQPFFGVSIVRYFKGYNPKSLIVQPIQK